MYSKYHSSFLFLLALGSLSHAHKAPVLSVKEQIQALYSLNSVWRPLQSLTPNCFIEDKRRNLRKINIREINFV